MTEKGTIFDIARFCTNDGPGIRTTVFLKGCPLRCIWCHNPESHNVKPELMYRAETCMLCGRCVLVCENNCHKIENGIHIFDRDKCIACGRCVDVCQGALRLAGKEISAEEVIKEVLKDKIYYKTSGGGVTISGGEPLFQADFATAILKAAKDNGIHTCIETSGYSNPKQLAKVLPFTDLFLFDQKESDNERHKEFTGVYNELIINNLETINKEGIPVILTCPIIPGLNDTDSHFSGIAEIAERFECVKEIHIRPYHTLGCAKYSQLGKSSETEGISAPDKEKSAEWRSLLQSKTNTKVTVD